MCSCMFLSEPGSFLAGLALLPGADELSSTQAVSLASHYAKESQPTA